MAYISHPVLRDARYSSDSTSTATHRVSVCGGGSVKRRRMPGVMHTVVQRKLILAFFCHFFECSPVLVT